MANLLLVIGFGCRWRAARLFASRPAPILMPIALPVLVLAPLFALPGVVPYASAFSVANGVMAPRAMACMRDYRRDRDDGSAFRRGLVLSEGVLAAMLGLRGLQGATVSGRGPHGEHA